MAADEFKAGNSFDFSGDLTVTGPAGPVLDLTGWTGRSQVRTVKMALIADLVFTWIDAAQRLYRLQGPVDTTGWPLGEAVIDIELTDPTGTINISTRTAKFLITEKVTKAAP